MTITSTISSADTMESSSVRSMRSSVGIRQIEQEPYNLVVLPSSNYLRSNLSTIRDVTTSGAELTTAFKRVATQIIAQGRAMAAFEFVSRF